MIEIKDRSDGGSGIGSLAPMTTEQMENKTERIDYLDALRTISCLAVVILHVSALQFYRVDFQTRDWNAVIFYESIVNWAVPVFVMISGAVMLKKEHTYRSIAQKLLGILRIFVVWSLLYLVSDIVLNKEVDYLQNALWLQVLLQGHYHMWYLIMLFGLYLIVPILKVITDRPNLLKAFVLLSLLFTFLIPSINDLPQRGAFFGAVQRAFRNVTDDASFHLTLGYTAYFVFGCFLVVSKRLPAEKARGAGLALLITGTLIVMLETRLVGSKEHALSFLQYYQIGIAAQSCGLLLIFKKTVGSSFARALAGLGPMTLGAYLIHPFFLELADKLGLTSLVGNRFISIPCLSLIIFLLSAAFSFLLLKTPLACIIQINRSHRKDDGSTKIL